MICYVKYFCVVWVAYSLLFYLRGIKYEFTFKWLKNVLNTVLDCFKCFAFWVVLAFSQDIFIAALFSFCAYILEKTINYLET